jgi:hypothetical protein
MQNSGAKLLKNGLLHCKKIAKTLAMCPIAVHSWKISAKIDQICPNLSENVMADVQFCPNQRPILSNAPKITLLLWKKSS